jgi:hypothetical protein
MFIGSYEMIIKGFIDWSLGSSLYCYVFYKLANSDRKAKIEKMNNKKWFEEANKKKKYNK